MPSASDTDIGLIRDVEGGVGLITLNRPKALNALNCDQFATLHAWLTEWAADPAVRLVVVQGAGDRAFCAGGDIRATYEHRGDAAFMRAVYGNEYRLNQLITRYPKPYVALMDGIVMGGGCGVSVHGSHRIVTETTLMAMPETGIGLFCDIGAAYFLSRAPATIGEYLGLTGHRIGAADAIFCRFADHFMPRDRLPELVDRLKQGGDLDRAIDDLAETPEPAPLMAMRETIDRSFGGDTIFDILNGLAGEGDDWADKTRAHLLKMCPFSLVATLRHIRQGRHRSVDDCLVTDYRLALRFMERNDFFEGVRALLVDKDNAPRWQPATLAEVDMDEINQCFAPLGDDDLSFD